MKSKEVKQLLQKYFDATTTLKEEQQLRDYFRSETVDPELEFYRTWFEELVRKEDLFRDAILEKAILEAVSNQEDTAGKHPSMMTHSVLTHKDKVEFIPEAPSVTDREKLSLKRIRYRQMWITVAGIAASLLIAFLGMHQYQQQQGFQDTFSNPDEALAYATKTLQYVSTKYNQGMQPLEQSFKVIEKGWKVIGD